LAKCGFESKVLRNPAKHIARPLGTIKKYTMTENKDDSKAVNKKGKMKCGIIMPIAPHSDYSKEHWTDVLNILTEAISETEFEPRLVSDDVAIGLIHDRIVTNIYNDEMVVCDVSSKNPNVMFELGLRLAFDKPTIIIKDEKTGYSFDTGVIEHISYPSSLRFGEIVDFKKELIKRIVATYKKSSSESSYSPFLKSFGKTIVPATLQSTEIPEGKYILEQLDILRHEIRSMRFDKGNYSIDANSLMNMTKSEKKKFFYNIKNEIKAKKLNITDKNLVDVLTNEAIKHRVNLSFKDIEDFSKIIKGEDDILFNYSA